MMAAYRELLAWQQRQNQPKTAPEVPDVDGSITHLRNINIWNSPLTDAQCVAASS